VCGLSTVDRSAREKIMGSTSIVERFILCTFEEVHVIIRSRL